MNIRLSIVSLTVLITTLGCAQQATPTAPYAVQVVNAPSECIGSTALPINLKSSFVAIDDPTLLQSALGEPTQGKLCQGQVYQATQNVTVYRAWNSTNTRSQFGQWWAFDQPTGLTADYRSQFEICYQWSALDKMSRCTLKAGTKIVVGNGQSATCSEYLTYEVSSAQQVYIDNAKDSVGNCASFDGVMQWQPIETNAQ